MRILSALLLAVIPSLALAAPPEVEIKFYLQPDSSGSKTENKSIELDDEGVLETEENLETRNELIERDATAAEREMLNALVRARIAQVSNATDAAEEPDYPYIEVQFELDGGAWAIEVEEVYQVGELPDAYVELQRVFFKSAFE